MRKIKKILILILSMVIFSTLFSCSKTGSAVDFYAFNTVIHVETHDFAISEDTKDKLDDLFTSLSQEFACNNSSSAVYKLNNAPANTEIKISRTAVEVFSISSNLYRFTDKKFNPAVLPLVRLWQFDDYNYPLQNFIPPSEQDILSCLGENLDFNGVIVDGTSKTVRKTNSKIELDFGGILKGYAVDKASEILLDAGHKKGYINVGSSSLYILGVDSLGVRHPRATENLQTIISVNSESIKNKAVSTSGDYEKYHLSNGVRYNHIIDPLTGYPTDTGVISATIIGGTGAFGDAVTTATCLMQHTLGSKNSQLVSFIDKILDEYPESLVFAVYDKNNQKEIITNATQTEHFTLLDSSYSINKI